MSRPAWMDRPHEFHEDVDDCSMCVCGVPAMHHRVVEPSVAGQGGENRG
jgi:hypothetical protein